MRDSKVLHNSSVSFESVGAKPLNTNKIELEMHMVNDVCDNRCAAARKLLILKTERCWSGRSGTLGKRLRPALPSSTETPCCAFDSTTYDSKMLLDVNP